MIDSDYRFFIAQNLVCKRFTVNNIFFVFFYLGIVEHRAKSYGVITIFT